MNRSNMYGIVRNLFLPIAAKIFIMQATIHPAYNPINPNRSSTASIYEQNKCKWHSAVINYDLQSLTFSAKISYNSLDETS